VRFGTDSVMKSGKFTLVICEIELTVFITRLHFCKSGTIETQGAVFKQPVSVAGRDIHYKPIKLQIYTLRHVCTMTDNKQHLLFRNKNSERETEL